MPLMNNRDFNTRTFFFDNDESLGKKCEYENVENIIRHVTPADKECGSWYTLGFTMGQILFSGCVLK
jgi:hypothetical protein